MISRVLTVGFMLLSVTLACAPASAGPHPCPELALDPPDAVTELALGLTRALGVKDRAAAERARQVEHIVIDVDAVDVVPVIASRSVR
jgi:hypothetical protein